MKLAPARRILGRVSGDRGIAPRPSHLRGRPSGRPRRPLLFEVQRRRDGHHRRIGGGAQEIHREFRRSQGNYFVDKVSGASIDVLSQASQIRDERIQKSATVEFVHDKTTYTASYQTSVERDYRSDTASIVVETGHVRRLDHVVARVREHRPTRSARTTARPSYPSSPGWGMPRAAATTSICRRSSRRT